MFGVAGQVESQLTGSRRLQYFGAEFRSSWVWLSRRSGFAKAPQFVIAHPRPQRPQTSATTAPCSTRLRS